MSTQINWNERTDDQSIVFDGTNNEVCEGCIVNLDWDGIAITVKVTDCTNDPWTGEVTGFPDSDVTEHGELKIGTTIKFEDRHIFRCAA